MKKSIFTLALITSCLFAYAQEKTVTLLTFGGYTFKDKIDFGEGTMVKSVTDSNRVLVLKSA